MAYTHYEVISQEKTATGELKIRVRFYGDGEEDAVDSKTLMGKGTQGVFNRWLKEKEALLNDLSAFSKSPILVKGATGVLADVEAVEDVIEEVIP